MNSKL
jgi:hypothetical protein